LSTTRGFQGTELSKIITLADSEKTVAILAITYLDPTSFLVMTTRNGRINKIALSEFNNIDYSGHVAIKLENDDDLAAVNLVEDEDDIILITQQGQSIRFNIAKVKPISFANKGVNAIRLITEDYIADVEKVDEKAHLLLITTKGFGKITPFKEYPRQNYGGLGVRAFNIVDKTGIVTSANTFTLTDKLLVSSTKGMLFNIPAKTIRMQGRRTQGARLGRVKFEDNVLSVFPYTSKHNPLFIETKVSYFNRPRLKDNMTEVVLSPTDQDFSSNEIEYPEVFEPQVALDSRNRLRMMKKAKTGTGSLFQILGGILCISSGLAAFIWALSALFHAFGVWAIIIALLLAPITFITAIFIVWLTTGIFPFIVLILWLASWLGIGIVYIGSRIGGK